MASATTSAMAGARRRGGRTAMRWLKRLVLAAVAAGLVATVVVAMLPQPVAVDLDTVTRGPMRVTVDEDGKTRVEHRYTISAPLTGNMLRLGLRPGDAVAAEQVLARIVPTAPPLLDARTRAEAEARLAAAMAAHRQTQAEVGRARVAHEHARREAARQRNLAAHNAAPQMAVDQAAFEERARAEELTAAELGVKVAAQAVVSARAALGLLQGRGQGKAPGGVQELAITAPVSGQVLRVLREDEGPVQAGTPLVELGDPASLEVVVDVLTADAVRIQPGAAVSLVRWSAHDDGAQALAAHVHRVEPSAFTRISALGVEEQRVNVVIDIDAPREQWQALGDGFRIETRIVVWEAADVLTVPASAVFREGERWAVYRVQDGIAHLMPVEVGQRNDARVQITSGLDAGDRIVLHPGDRIVEGVEVVPRSRQRARRLSERRGDGA